MDLEMHEERYGHDSVETQIPRDELSLYEQAAKETGYDLEVIAQQGQIFYRKRELTGTGEPRTYTVDKGNVAVSIKRPVDSSPQQGHSLFWQRLDSLKAEQSTQSTKPQPPQR